METLIRNALNEPHHVVEDVLPACYKLLHWLSLKRREELSYREVELLLKAATFVDECYAIFGESLVESLLNEYEYQKPLLDQCLKRLRGEGYLTFTSRSILESDRGYKYALTVERLEQLIQQRRQLPSNVSNIYATDEMEEQLPPNRRKMQQLLHRLFSLPEKQIECALKRLLKHSDFALLGYVLKEPRSSPYHEQSVIVAQKLCDCVREGSVESQLWASMYRMAAQSKKGIKFYWQCLENRGFALSIMEFFMRFVGELCEKEVDVGGNVKHKGYVIEQVLFLMHCTLALKSPCRMEFYVKLGNCEWGEKTFKNFVNKLVCIYD